MAVNRTIRDGSLRPSAHVSLASNTVAFAMAHGLTLDKIAAASGMRAQDLVDPASRLPEEVVPLIWDLLTKHAASDEPLTMKMAAAAPASFFADLAHGAQFATTLREAIELLIEHRRILSDQIEADLVIGDGEAALVARHPLDALDAGRTSEMGLAFVWRLLNELSETAIRLLRVEFSHAATGRLDGYARVFGIDPVFGQPRTALVIPDVALDHRVRNGDPQLLGYVRHHLAQTEARLASSGNDDSLGPLRAAIIQMARRGLFGPQEVAERAGLSYRQAQRLAARHGTTMRDLIEDYRLAMASEMLGQTGRTVEDIAMALGYTDDRAFRRAFKRRYLVSPSRFRKGQTS